MKASANSYHVFKQLSIALLMGVYAYALLFDAFHNILHHEHHHQHEVCTEEAEKDPCHKRIFHHDLAEGCKHKTHMFAFEQACNLCDAIIGKYYFPVEKVFSQIPGEIVQRLLPVEQQLVVRISIPTVRLRAPPLLPSLLV